MNYHTFCPKCQTQYYETPHNDECDWCVPEVKLLPVVDKTYAKTDTN